MAKSKWVRHKERWEHCDQCELCETRKNVVLLRGRIPCDVLFIGEAPGISEDVLNAPFVGPAGKLLDRIVDEALPEGTRTAFTNLICCIPLDIDGNKVLEPDKEHIKACSERLQEIYTITNPTAVVMVGKLSKQYVPQLIKGLTKQLVDIIHPAAILRADISQRGLAIQQSVVRVRDVLEEVPF